MAKPQQWDEDLKMENLAFYETLDANAIEEDDDSEMLEDEDLTQEEAAPADRPEPSFGETINPLLNEDSGAEADSMEDDDVAENEELQEELSRQAESEDDKTDV